MRTTLAVVLLTGVLSACAGGVTGIGGESEYECRAPKGVPCMSMSGVYANVRAGNVPGLNTGPATAAPKGRADTLTNPANPTNPTTPTIASEGWIPVGDGPQVGLSSPASLATASLAQPGAYGKVSPTVMNVPASGTPLRTPERVLRIWIAPLEDSEGTLHDQRYVYVQVERGQWLLQAFQESGRQVYAPVKRMPAAAEKPEGQPQAPAEAAQEAARRNGALFVPGAAPPPRQAEPATGPKE